MKTLSLSMIVKNEEKAIGKCLDSIKNYVDEIIIVDTGSTDRTKEIAQEYGAKVFDFEWTHSFADARNFSKSKATMDWILWMDADEYFVKDQAEKIKETIEKAESDILTIKISNFAKKDQMGVTHISPRLFENKEEIGFKNKIHEQVVKNGTEAEFGTTNIKIMHTGYLQEVIDEKQKYKRNAKLIKLELNKNPKDGFMNLNLANEYMHQGKYEKAIKYSKKAYKYGEGRSYQTRAVTNIIHSLQQLKRNEEALEVTNEAILKYQGYTELMYMKAGLLTKLGRMTEANEYYGYCVEQGESKVDYQTISGVGSYLAAESLADNLLKMRDIEPAMELYRSVLGVNKFSQRSIRALLLMLKPQSTDEEILKFIDDYYNDEDTTDLRFKLLLINDLRIKEGIFAYYEKFKDVINESKKGNWLLFEMLSGDSEKIKRSIKKQREENKEWLPLALLYGFLLKDEEMKEMCKSEDTGMLIWDILDGKSEKKNFSSLNEKIYIGFIKEMVLFKEYEVVEKLVQKSNVFGNPINRKLGDIFYDNFMDDLAIEYYTKYLQKEKMGKEQDGIYLTVAEMLYGQEMYEEALLLAEKAWNLNQTIFRPIEIMVECCKKLKEYDAVNEIVRQSLKIYPDSKYLTQHANDIV